MGPPRPGIFRRCSFFMVGPDLQAGPSKEANKGTILDGQLGDLPHRR
jgi:hypothetical protein